MKDKKRALRRHHDETLAKRYTKVVKEWDGNTGSQLNRVQTERSERSAEERAKRICQHPKTCSCDMCGNPRNSKAYKGKSRLTKQELKQRLREKD